MPVIYIDILFILNVWVDFLLLSATARLTRVAPKGWRLLLGAVCGGVLSVILFLPPLHWAVALLIRMAGTVALALIAFPYQGKRQFFKGCFTLLLLCAVFAGLATMLWYFVAPAGFLTVNGVIYYDAPASLLIVFTAVSYVAVCLFEKFLRRRAPENRLYRLTVSHQGKTVVCDCLYDSGCTLREPFSALPAVVMEQDAAIPLIPEKEQMRYIPFRSLASEGLLPAFRPEKMVFSHNGKTWDMSGCYLALCEQPFREEYAALVGTDMGERMTGGKGV